MNNAKNYNINEKISVSVESPKTRTPAKGIVYDTYKVKIEGDKDSNLFELPRMKCYLSNSGEGKWLVRCPVNTEKASDVRDFCDAMSCDVAEAASFKSEVLRKKFEKTGMCFEKGCYSPSYKLDHKGKPELHENGERVVDPNRPGNLFFKVNEDGYGKCLVYGINGKKIDLNLLKDYEFEAILTINFYDVFSGRDHLLLRSNVKSMLVISMVKKGNHAMVVNKELLKESGIASRVC